MSHQFDYQRGSARIEALAEELRQHLPLFVEKYEDEYLMNNGGLLSTVLLGRLVTFISDYAKSSQIEQDTVMRTISGLLEPIAGENDRTMDMLLRTGFFEDLWIMGSMRKAFAETLGPQMRRILVSMQQEAAAGSKTVSDPMH